MATVGVGVQVLEEPTVRFLKSFGVPDTKLPHGGYRHAEVMFAEVLQGYGPPELGSRLTERMPGILSDTLGWKGVPESGRPDAELSVTVEAYSFHADDPRSALSVYWKVRILLADAATNEILFRDCLEYSAEGYDLSLQQLSRSEEKTREVLFRQLVTDLAEAITQRFLAR